MNNSYIIVVTNMETSATEFYAQWEPELPEHAAENRDEELYKHAQPILARMLNKIGSGAVVVHIELTAA